MSDTEIISLIIYIVPLLSLVVSVLTFSNAVKERNSKSAAEAVSLKKDIELLSEKVSSLEHQFTKVNNGYYSNDKRITTLEHDVRSLDHRVKYLEER